MGCCFSTEEEQEHDVYENYPSRSRSIPLPTKQYAPTPKYGEYKCNGCGRFWISRCSWSGKYQNCKRCIKPVYPQFLRDLQSSDFNGNEEKPHEKEYCQMCQQLGRSCGQLKKNMNKNNHSYS